ncbi:MAG: hypothetical protein EA403_09875 [Spirochaetaceae bacterium]|nr:MAG: hypothetical protein EA403_09875 [Spirochaetaceae bacterium]
MFAQEPEIPALFFIFSDLDRNRMNIFLIFFIFRPSRRVIEIVFCKFFIFQLYFSAMFLYQTDFYTSDWVNTAIMLQISALSTVFSTIFSQLIDAVFK